MLRALVLLFALLNAALFLWIRSDPAWATSDREPQRLERQVHPEAIQVLPDLPHPGGRGEDAAEPPTGGASDANANPAPAAASLARKASIEIACVESEPLTPAQWSALSQALARAGVPADAIAERRQPQAGRWMVYMGRYADEPQWQHKADELKRLNLKFERVSAPPGLDPGLSLGIFASAEDASVRLDELGRHGVHTARVVETPAAAAALRRLQVRGAGEAWRSAVAGQRFSACAPAASAST
jgi:hypothetical protein